MKTIIITALLGTSTLCCESQPVPTANSTSNVKERISIQEMLISGPPQIKMHSLAMISQGKLTVNQSYIPGLKACAEDSSAALRSISAKLLGKHFIQGQDIPNLEVMSILQELASDEASDVRFNAIFYGLTQVKNITPELAEQFVDIAAKERNPALQDRIIISLANYQHQVEAILNKKLNGDNAIAYYEIYEEFTGKEPPNADKFLDLPSSRPHLLIIKSRNKDSEASKSALTTELSKAGLNEPTVELSGKGDNYALMLTTYITRDYQTAKKLLSNHDQFSITQDLWLTPELEIQMKVMRSAQN